MPIAQLAVVSFRNLADSSLTFHPKINLIHGDNGSGKTSLLEAIYYLSHNRSFRTSLSSNVIAHGKNDFILRLQLENLTEIALQKTSRYTGYSLEKIKVNKFSTIAKLLPTLLIDSKAHHIIDAAPEYRRNMINWALFHVEPGFAEQWKNYQRLLKQRNAAIRSGLSINEIQTWDSPLVAVGNVINELRRDYCVDFIAYFRERMGAVSDFSAVSTHYQQGWDSQCELADVLASNISNDCRVGYTQYGPHRFDVAYKFNSAKNVKDVFSRGQQKLFIALWLLLQAQYVQEKTGNAVMLLVDDLPSELDVEKRAIFLRFIQNANLQTFITCIAVDDVLKVDASLVTGSVFHVEHGTINQLSSSDAV